MDNHNQEGTAQKEQSDMYGFLEREAMRIARWPKTYFWVAFVISFGLSFIGMAFGDFSISTEEGGWESRGTPIANRQTQLLLVTEHQNLLHEGDENTWSDLTENVQRGWHEDYDEDYRRRLAEIEAAPAMTLTKALFGRQSSHQMYNRRHLPSWQNDALTNFLTRRLQLESSTRLSGCDTEWYTDGRMTNETRLWPVWKVTKKGDTALEPAILKELCLSEEVTQLLLEEKGLCFGCEESAAGRRCLPPYGPVFYARALIPNGMDMDCEALAAAWAPYQAETELEWKDCVEYLEDPARDPEAYLDHCSKYFFSSLMDEFFDTTGNVEYTSSIFATTEDMVDDLYENVDHYGKGGDRIEAAYDTQDQDFVNILAENAVGMDMLLATGSALITAIAILIHTRSPFLTLVGLIQIALSFPLAFFIYRFLGQFDFFPFLNFIGVFVVFALGADHVFVAVDKWKNARLDNPNGTTEQIAAKALPSAASAMFLTTSTTAAAFFGTAICPVAPVKLFAIFCGLLITFDYVMDVALLFPCLCIYDGYRDQKNCCISCHCCQFTEARNGDEERPIDQGGSHPEDEPIKTSLIRRILLNYYSALHKLRWPLFVVSIAAFIVCCVFALQLDLPLSSDVRILRSSIEYERSYEWRQNLLYEALDKKEGSLAHVMWGVIPADTGNHNDPASWSTLELDESFDPSTEAAQKFLKEFCPKFFAEDFARPDDYECAINRFDSWLLAQSTSATPDETYSTHCAGATGLPMDSNAFHPCVSIWAEQEDAKNILSHNGIVEIILVPFNSQVRYDSRNSELDEEWNKIEDWMKGEMSQAPQEVNKAFFSSMDFWWYDTNTQMFKTAYGSAAIALAAAAMVILLSSRSLVMTFFSVASIGYVLASVTSMMVAAGWTLGFLESICFAILIGVSVDFVIHFSHAYTTLPGEVSRELRTKHALIDMGPSILAAAFTTLAGATIMLFCVITFFTKFALVLFFTIVQATIGSFVVFLTLADCTGPSQPTLMADRLVEKCRATKTARRSEPATSEDDLEETAHTTTQNNASVY
jgi:hypothetical protein